MDIDYLIIGQGLAGSLLAWELVQRDQKVIIIDNGKENASLIAAGLINPVTGMRFVKSTGVDYLLPAALDFYQRLAYFFQQTFYIEKPMLRILRSNKELIACQKRLPLSSYKPFLDKIIPTFSTINAPIGILKQKQSGYLLTRALLSALKTYFVSLNSYIKTDFNYDDIKIAPDLQWQQFKPKRIIFCEGHLGINNPWFSWLPFQPVKGEIITASSSNKIIDKLLNYGQWYIPLDSYQFRTGATFDWDNLDTNITLSAKESLLKSLKQVYPDLKSEKIIRQQAGVRPTTLDKQPFIGSHPHHSELVFFNGFGAKGSLQIPWYCQCLADHLLYRKPVPSSSNILRYYE